ncbi:hypothetical protein [Oceanicola sp. S124]|uniref:hypothetical protein n=1 Tax=Oceanicola sp. S124 TaxID=1042378 RepID=UPI000255907F|nr:hypothetical protein [Oceanicola sp. S124]
MDLLLLLLPLLVGLVTLVMVIRWLLEDEIVPALGLPLFGLFMLGAFWLVGPFDQVPGLNRNPGPVLGYMSALALSVFGVAGLGLCLLWLGVRALVCRRR